jgi:HK97 family phage portal protein
MKAVLDFLRGEFEFHTAELTGSLTKQLDWWTGATGWSGGTNTGVAVTTETAMESATAFACTRALSETLATIPAAVMEQQDLETRRKARENPLWALLHDQPNPRMDSTTWYELNARRVINRGTSLNIIEFNGRGLPIALWPVHNSRYEVWVEDSRQLRNGRFLPGKVAYRVYPDQTGRHYWVQPEEVLHIVGGDTDDGLTAQGVVHRMRHEISLDLAQSQYVASMFKNGAIPLGFIKTPWIEDPDVRKALRNDINSIHTGRENWNKIGILWDKDATWEHLNFSPEDVEALASRIFSAKTICRAYNVPPAIVQIFDDYKFATVEAMLKHFIMLGVRPLSVRFERAINQQVLGPIEDMDLLLNFVLEALLRGDPAVQAQVNIAYRQFGILSGDEIRQRDLGMNPMENGLGAVRLAPMNYAPLERVAKGENMQDPRARQSDKQRQRDDANKGDDDEEKDTSTGLPRFDRANLAGIVAGVIARRNGKPGTLEPLESLTDHGPCATSLSLGKDDSLHTEEAPEALAARSGNVATHTLDPANELTVDGYARQVTARTLSRMTGKERKAILQQARKGGGLSDFKEHLTAFYARFTTTLAAALAISADGIKSDGLRPEAIAARLAVAHTTESRKLIAALLASDRIEREGLNTALANALSDWTDRKPIWEALE